MECDDILAAISSSDADMSFHNVGVAMALTGRSLVAEAKEDGVECGGAEKYDDLGVDVATSDIPPVLALHNIKHEFNLIKWEKLVNIHVPLRSIG